MNERDISDGTKLGLTAMITVSLFIIVYNIYIMLSGAITFFGDRAQQTALNVDTQTVLALTEVDKDKPISGATLYASLCSYGDSVAGIVVDAGSGLGVSTQTVYKSTDKGTPTSIEALEALIEKAGYQKNYYLFRSETPAGQITQVQDIWLKIVQAEDTVK